MGLKKFVAPYHKIKYNETLFEQFYSKIRAVTLQNGASSYIDKDSNVTKSVSFQT